MYYYEKINTTLPPRIALLASFLLMLLFGACQKPENDELLSPEPTTQFDNGKSMATTTTAPSIKTLKPNFAGN
ncbi:MAG: hypothetical protein IPL35_01760 [Sphingobacteriales bacterium]|nr:hypothetical protein [Sphingobacteriales bacterium]